MKLAIIVVGIDHWGDLTFPLLRGLAEHGNENVLCVDNGSSVRYPFLTAGHNVSIPTIYQKETVGYGAALNLGTDFVGEWDWLMCCNNDCVCDGFIDVSKLDENTVYGNDWKYQYEGRNEMPAVLDSAYFLISRKVWEDVGGFDEGMDAAFEEVDYCLRALRKGYKLDVVKLPVYHLNLHTRRELAGYNERWNRTAEYFRSKYRDTGFQITA